MELSVVVPTLNARDELADCLDALAEHAPDAEVVVVNGPSADGTTGMVQKRGDVGVLVELADRTINAARNAGIERARGDRIAFVNHTLSITSGWQTAVREGLAEGDVVTGPTDDVLDGATAEGPEQSTIASRAITFLNPGNFAFRAEVTESLDGFDEYLDIGGARDFAHRLAASEFGVGWDERMCVSRDVGADGGALEVDRGWKYRSLAYRLVKNYSLRPTVLRRLLGHATGDAYRELKSVVRGDTAPSDWLAGGRDVVTNLLGGTKDGLGARRRDDGPRYNPNGRSARADRAVTVYDWRT